MNNDLMLAVLSMAAYQNDPPTVGFATKLTVPLPANYQATGFFAVAYNYGGQTVIAYRGTDGDYLTDAWYGWGTGVAAESTQAGQAALFYKDVAAQQDYVGTFPYSTNIVFTGHSLGGGLAGLMADLSSLKFCGRSKPIDATHNRFAALPACNDNHIAQENAA